MRLRTLVVPAVLLAVALPAQARAGSFSGTVVAKQSQRGTLLVAGARGVGVTMRGGVARAVVGDRVEVRGTRLRDGTVRVSRLLVLGHARTARVRGTVLRDRASGTVLASGRSVVVVRRSQRKLASAGDHGLRTGQVVEFRVRFDHEDAIETAPPTPIAAQGDADIEATIVTVSPLVVSLDGLPLTITVPAGMTLPTTLAPGQRVELTVQADATNRFTLVSIDQVEDANPAAAAQEVEAKGFVVSSSTSQIVIDANGVQLTFVAPPGVALPVFPVGASVEARGVRQNGVITLTRLRSDDGGDGGGDDGGGSGGGGDGGH